MKRIIIILFFCIAGFKGFSQFNFPSTDSLHRYTNRFITNSAINAFTDYRMNTLLNGIINWIDIARLGTSGSVGVDTIYALNDSTIRYRKNLVNYTFNLRGNRWTFQQVLNNGSTLTSNNTIILADSLKFTSGKVIMTDSVKLSGLPSSSDSTNKPLAKDANGNVIAMTYWPGGISVSDTTNKWVNDIRRSNDSIYAFKNGSWQFKFKDTTIVPTLNQVVVKGNIDSVTGIQFGVSDSGFVQTFDGTNHIGIPFKLYPYLARDTNVNNPKPIYMFETQTTNYDGGQPLNTVTNIYRFGTAAIGDHFGRIGFEQLFYGGGEYHVAYKHTSAGSETRMISGTWSWDNVDASTLTFRSLTHNFTPETSDTAMLSMTPGQTTINNWRNATPTYRVAQYANDGTKSGFSLTTSGNQTLWNWHLNTPTPNNQSLVWDLPGTLIAGCNRSSASTDPEFDLRFANLSNNVFMQWKRSTRIMGILRSGSGGNDHWVLGANYSAQTSNALNAVTYRDYHQKPFGVAIANSADSLLKAPISTDTLGNLIVNIPNPASKWQDGLLFETNTQNFRVYGTTLLDSAVDINDVAAGSVTDSVLTISSAGRVNKRNASAFSGITTINSQTGSSQTLSAGPGLTISSSSDVHTFTLTTTDTSMVTDVNNSGTSETDLYSRTEPANKLTLGGQALQFTITGSFNDATATNQIRGYFAGTEIFNSGALAITGVGDWKLVMTVTRATSTTARCDAIFTADSVTISAPVKYTALSGLDWTTTNVYKVTGTAGGAGGGSNDITAHIGKVIFIP